MAIVTVRRALPCFPLSRLRFPSHADEAERRVGCRIEQLALQRFEPPPKHVGLRRVQLGRETFQPFAVRSTEVDLHGLGDAFRLFMIS